MGYRINLSGKIINNITIVSFSHNDKKRNSVWNCICYCGSKFKTIGTDIKSGNTKSCGCLQVEIATKICTDRRKWENSDRSLYCVWHSMIDRCHNSNNRQYKNYGGRGIKVYKKWKDDFDEYCKWIQNNLGPKPSLKYSLDRINNNSGYRPGNLRWASALTQSENRRLKKTTKLTKQKVQKIRESSLSGKELAKKYKVSEAQISRIINNKGWKIKNGESIL